MTRAWKGRDQLEEMGYIAGRDVREWVSADPGEDFALELAVVAGGGGT
jgi:hypothetical protein